MKKLVVLTECAQCIKIDGQSTLCFLNICFSMSVRGGGGGYQINVFCKMFQMYKSNVLIMFCFSFHFLRSRVHITTERQLTSSRLSTVTTPTSCWLITGRKENTGRKLSSVEESSAIYISKKFQKVDKLVSTCTTTLEHF